MNLKDLEFTAERLANATLFGEGEREALKTARDLIAALRAANDLPADFQAKDLVSLIYFYEANHDAVVTPLEPPLCKVSGLEPVTSSAFIKERLDAITVG